MATRVLIISSITESAPYKPDIELVKGLAQLWHPG